MKGKKADRLHLRLRAWAPQGGGRGVVRPPRRWPVPRPLTVFRPDLARGPPGGLGGRAFPWRRLRWPATRSPFARWREERLGRYPRGRLGCGLRPGGTPPLPSGRRARCGAGDRRSGSRVAVSLACVDRGDLSVRRPQPALRRHLEGRQGRRLAAWRRCLTACGGCCARSTRRRASALGVGAWLELDDADTRSVFARLILRRTPPWAARSRSS